MSIIVFHVPWLEPHSAFPPHDREPEVHMIADLPAAIAAARSGPVLVLVERAALSIARLLARGVPPRTALRRWSNETRVLLGQVQSWHRDLIVVCRKSAESDPHNLAMTLRETLGAEISPAAVGSVARAASYCPVDPILEVIAEFVLSTDSEALAADAELGSRLFFPMPLEESAALQARLVVASAAFRYHVARSEDHERLKFEYAALAEAQRLSDEQFNLMSRSREELLLPSPHSGGSSRKAAVL